MFKKELPTLTRRDLSRVDSKSVRGRSVYADPAGGEGEILSEAKILGLVKCSIFFQKSCEDPIGFTCNSDDVLPSLYTLWAWKPTIPTVFVPPAVSTFVLRGANLMLPGIQRRGLPASAFSFPKGAVVSVQVLGNPFAIAVGRAILSGQEILASGVDAKGCGVEILHFFGDGLWRLGSKSIPPGFGFELIGPCNEPRETAPIIKESISPNSDTVEGEDIISDSEMDSLGWGAFYFVAKTVVDSDLPMNASALYSRMQQHAKTILESGGCLKRLGISRPPPGTKLDLKKSGWKSFSKFLEILVEKNLVSSKLVRNERMITRLSKDHPEVKAFIIPSSGEAERTTPIRQSLVKVWFMMEPAWTALLEGNPEGSRKELTDRLSEYLRQFKGGSIDLMECDERLRKALRDQKSAILEKKDISKKFNDSLISCYSISTELPPRVRKGTPPKVAIAVKRVAGNKFSTTVSGLGQYSLNESEFSAEISRIFSVSSSVTDKGIYCQGNMADALIAYLVNEIGIPVECIKS